MLQKLSYNFEIALSAIVQNKLRSFLTSLGIIFGVGSVITMMAIGAGAKEKILEQMQTLGTRNLIIQPVVDQPEGEEGETDGKTPRRWSPGLTMEDAEAIQAIIPEVSTVSPEIVLEYSAIVPGRNIKAKLVGVTQNYFDPVRTPLLDGNVFTEEQLKDAAPICVIGYKVKAKLFPNEKDRKSVV